MAESAMDLYNVAKAQLGDQNAGNPFYVLSNGISTGIQQATAEIQQRRQLELLAAEKLKQQQAEFEQFKRQTSLMTASQETTKPIINTILGRADRNAANPTYAGTTVIKPPKSAMMSLATGEYGDVNGQPIAQPVETPADSSMQGLFTTAQAQIPSVESDPAYTVTPEMSYTSDSGAKYGMKLTDNNAKLDELKVKGAELGIDTNGMNRSTIIKSIADKKIEGTARENRMTKQNDFNNAAKLRYEFNNNQITKDFNTLNRSFKSIEKAYDTSTNDNTESRIASDQALGVMIQKMLDPASVVRESEYARTPEGAALMNRLGAFLPKLQKGGLAIANQDRKAILDMARQLFDAGGEVYNQHYQRYADLAGEMNIDPNKIFGGIKPYEKSNTYTGPTAVNAKGEKLQLSEDGKSWVPAK